MFNKAFLRCSDVAWWIGIALIAALLSAGPALR